MDFELRGCPINKSQLVEVISAFLHDRQPNTPAHSVCVECKLRGTVCVMVAHGTPCLGPVTHAGCGALCPAYTRGCYGCYRSDGNTEYPLAGRMAGAAAGRSESTDLTNSFRNFNAYAEAFRKESEAHEIAQHQR